MNKKTPFVKVCGQTSLSSLDTSYSMGVRFCGFIFHPRSPRSVSVERAARLKTTGMKRVGIFVEQGSEEIVAAMEKAQLDYAQLHGNQDEACARAIGPERVIRVLWPQRYASMEALQEDIDRFADSCAYFLLDAGTAGGGSGKTLPVDSLSGLRFPRPWILAGGLNAENLSEMLGKCHPDGIDLNSGIEFAPGLKSPVKLLSVFHELSQPA
ncbi:phosphoribosylanthranilate isomerase [Akkermansia glycaniphila]|uniref:phosphoribosylanthranilate isomerase n=1 Tax=Akkermansia glycaniphila TaxID=1679444 RepID=UPI001C010E7E|nr:phosphoribosylanthranilate isomerase [Akkermansia glycaniphila]MBT9450655.1 phosphoribosylanthranilate isomerase [Akkermansia glycaniphila]